RSPLLNSVTLASAIGHVAPRLACPGATCVHDVLEAPLSKRTVARRTAPCVSPAQAPRRRKIGNKPVPAAGLARACYRHPRVLSVTWYDCHPDVSFGC